MTDREQEIQARCEAATPGPWRAMLCEWECDCGRVPLEGCDHDPCSCEHGAVLSGAYVPEIKTVEWGDYTDMNDADATFVANSREDVPYLLSETARLRAELSRMTDKYNDALKDYGTAIDMLAERKLERRASAAVRDISQVCDTCKHDLEDDEISAEICGACGRDTKWEWRGECGKRKGRRPSHDRSGDGDGAHAGGVWGVRGAPKQLHKSRHALLPQYEPHNAGRGQADVVPAAGDRRNAARAVGVRGGEAKEVR